jgi:hypothetical protein
MGTLTEGGASPWLWPQSASKVHASLYMGQGSGDDETTISGERVMVATALG